MDNHISIAMTETKATVRCSLSRGSPQACDLS